MSTVDDILTCFSGNTSYNVSIVTVRPVHGCWPGAINSDSQCFWLGEQPQKLPLPLRGPGPHPVMIPWAHMSQPQTASRSV